MDLLNDVKAKVTALRDRAAKVATQNPSNAKLKPIEQRRRGYQLYVQEANQLGDDPKPYDDWIRGQE